MTRKHTYAARFAGRTAVVTGGASGMGKATAARLIREGARVILWDLDQGSLEQAAQELGADGVYSLDVSDADAVETAAGAALEQFGKLDMLLCSAGIGGPVAPVSRYTLADWRRVISVNLDGVFYTCRAFADHMKGNGYGRIVNVASIAGKEGNPNSAAYSASKAGVIGLTKVLGKELATSGVTVNVVTPGVFDTPMLSQATKEHLAMMRSKIPMGRIGEVEEISAMICWLLSEECSFSTGAVFDLSGGRATY